MKKISFDDHTILDSCILTVGNFDGVHLGHIHLIQEMKKLSIINELPIVLLTFKQHTNEIVSNKKLNLLTPQDLKFKKLSDLKIDFISLINFNEKFSKMDIDLFMKLIIQKYNPKFFFIGYDNKFGYKRKGSYEYFSKNIIYNKITFKTLNPFIFNNKEVKSSLIKDKIAVGDIREANKLLGYKYKIIGNVVKGRGIGRKIGFPTLNIDLKYKKQLIPSNGVYSVNLKLDKKSYFSICNIGIRPTVSNNSILSIEVHILDLQDIVLYKKEVEVDFIDKIRNEIKFNSVEELKKQIFNDINFLKKESNG